MSHWKATAEARDVSPKNLRAVLVSALETVHLVSDALGLGHGPLGIVRESEILGAIVQLDTDRAEAVDSEHDARETEAAMGEIAATAVDRALAANMRADKAERALAVVRSERDGALVKLAKFDCAMVAFSDHLAMARKFVTAAADAGIKVTHVRPANRNGRAVKVTR